MHTSQNTKRKDTETVQSSLSVGQRCRVNLPEGKELFVNDKYMHDIEIEEDLDDMTINRGEVASGTLSTANVICINNVDDKFIYVDCTQIGGSNDGAIRAAISKDLFAKYFTAEN